MPFELVQMADKDRLQPEEWTSLLACVSSVRAEPANLRITETPYLYQETFTFSANQHNHFTFYMLVYLNITA